jgi:predicted outer membrane repeat protein
MSSRTERSFLAMFILLAISWNNISEGANLIVGPGGYSTIQSAINAAVSGQDEIQVAAGTYYEAIDFIGKAVRLYSKEGTDVTTIDGTGYEHVVQCINGEGPETILEGFTITGGSAGYHPGSLTGEGGGGMYIFNSNPTILSCIFANNTSAGIGGGIHNYNSSPTVTDCTFSGNSAEYDGGGIYNVINSSPTITNCIFMANSAGTYGNGGGMSNAADSNPTVTNSTFNENAAGWLGGGIANYECSPTISNCSFNGNESGQQGGGICNYYGNPVIKNCTFSRNRALSMGGGIATIGSSAIISNSTFSENIAEEGYGGGISAGSGSEIISDCSFSGNSAGSRGGGIFYEGAGDNPIITNCTFNSNFAAATGGGMGIWNYGNPSVTNCTFKSNSSSSQGGGMAIELESNPTIANCIFTENSADDFGGGLLITWNASPVITNCTFSENSAGYRGGGIGNFASLFAINCIFWSNAGGEIYEGYGTVNVQYSDIEGGLSGTGNINSDPLFIDPTNGDFRLQSGSPCIDVGDNSAVVGIDYDLDGNQRVVDGNNDGNAVVDMGVYESSYSEPSIADTIDFFDQATEDGTLEPISGGRLGQSLFRLERWYLTSAENLIEQDRRNAACANLRLGYLGCDGERIELVKGEDAEELNQMIYDIAASLECRWAAD